MNWSPTSTRARLYMALRRSNGGLVMGAIRQQLADKNVKAIEACLAKMANEGWITAEGQRGHKRYMAGGWAGVPPVAPEAGEDEIRQLRERALSAIADCQAGIGCELLRVELKTDPGTLSRVVEQLVAARLVRVIEMAPKYGGGVGYIALPMALDAGSPPAPADVQPAAIAPTAATGAWTADGKVVAITVSGQVDMDAVYNGSAVASGQVELLECERFAVIDGRLHVTAGDGSRTVFSAQTTRELFRFLDELGGLDLEAVLPAPQPTAPAAEQVPA